MRATLAGRLVAVACLTTAGAGSAGEPATPTPEANETATPTPEANETATPTADANEPATPTPLVWGGAIGIAVSVGAAGAASGLMLSASATGDSTDRWTSVGLYIGAGVALVVGASLVIVGASADGSDSEAKEPVASTPAVALTPTAGGLLLHGRF